MYYFLPTLLVLFLSTPRPTTAFPFTQSDWDDPASLGAQLLYSNNNNKNNNNNNNVLQISGNNQPVNGDPIACKSDSGDSLNFFSIGKRGIEMCPHSLETIPDKKSTPAQPILKDVDRPLRFTSPDSLSPFKTDPLADDDKCPTRLMKMSKIPVCDSGKLGRDSMRLSGETTYTLFNIRPYSDSDPCLWPCKPWCCVATGTQKHPLFPLDPPVPTGYICRNIDDEIFFQDYDPLAHPQADDPGKWPELPPSQTE